MFESLTDSKVNELNKIEINDGNVTEIIKILDYNAT